MNGTSSGQASGTPGTQITVEQGELKATVANNESSVTTVHSSYGNKQSAIAGTSSYLPAIASSAKKFFKGSSNAYNNYSITKEPDGSYHFIMEKPGNVPGSKAVYHKIVDANGKTVSVYKDTFDPQGNLVHRKDK